MRELWGEVLSAYYNEIDPYCVEWLRNLISAGLIPDGDVDSRSIEVVSPDDLAGYDQCHFFAGLGGWAYAARLAGWPDERPIWTGSCPCQPFSGVGKRLEFEDPRHLWPAWFRLIGKRKPSVIFGEQVATATAWLDLVLSDLEPAGYACGAFDLPAACVGARQERQRLWFVADSDKARWSHAEGITTAQAQADIGRPVGVVHRQAVEYLRWQAEPGEDWVVDGIFGEGYTVSAYGNAIVPQVAAQLIRAYMDARCE